jgi:hypothetical protein
MTALRLPGIPDAAVASLAVHLPPEAFARADTVIVEAPSASARALDRAAPTAPALQARNPAATLAPEPRP